MAIVLHPSYWFCSFDGLWLHHVDHQQQEVQRKVDHLEQESECQKVTSFQTQMVADGLR